MKIKLSLLLSVLLNFIVIALLISDYVENTRLVEKYYSIKYMHNVQEYKQHKNFTIQQAIKDIIENSSMAELPEITLTEIN